MKINFKFAAMAMIAAAMVTSCSDDSSEVTPAWGDEATIVKSGEALPTGQFGGELVIEEGASVTLDGALHITSGGVLYINPGVTITAQWDEANCDYILIEQGAKIEADGDAAAGVIVMTSTKKEIGAWGGLHICCKAPINTSIPSKSEVAGCDYGGSDAADNSGTLRYIRLEYTGYIYNKESECNGISFYGVGNGTKVEYCQAYRGSDDGFEFFGGTVDIKYCVVTSCSDDAFDWTDGWVGRAQFLVAYNEDESTLGYSCDCLMECDTNGDNYSVTPASHPVISNATLVSSTSSKSDGVMLKAGTQIELYNSIIVGKTYSVYVKEDVADAALTAGTSVLSYVLTDTGLTNGSASKTFSSFLTAGNNSASFSASSLSSNYVGTVSGADSAPFSDSFFTSVSYTGAIESSNDWTKGWTL